MTSEKVKSLAREAHGNIYPNSDAYTFERGYIHGYEDALDKACEWLLSQNLISRCIVDDMAFVKRFKKAME